MLEQTNDLHVVHGWHPTMPLLEPRRDPPAVDGVQPTVPVLTLPDDTPAARQHTAVQMLAPMEDAPVFGGRHRAEPAAGRTLTVRAGLAAVAVLAATVLGLLAAGTLGLTGSRGDASSGASAPGAATELPSDSAFDSTVDIAASGPRHRHPSPTTVARPATEAPAPVAAADDAAAPDAAGPVVTEAARAPATTVSPGDRCQDKGATGVTADGRRAVCRGGHGRPRWRLA